MSLDLDPLRRDAAGRLGDVLLALGAKVRGSADRGRSSCPVHGGDSLSAAFANGIHTCHSGCGGKSRDALALIAEVDGLDLRRREDLGAAAVRLAEILGTAVEAAPRRVEAFGGRPAPSPLRSPSRPGTAPVRDAAALWERLSCRDGAGEEYLRGRGLLEDPLPSSLVRFNRGSSDPWLAAREADGYVLAFAVRGADGAVRTISLRHIGPGVPPEERPKTIALAGCSTSGAAICRPEVVSLGTSDPEFSADELVLCEGGPDALAATMIFDRGALEGETPPTWALGAIGVASVPGVLRAFSAIVRGRVVHLALDADRAGDEGVLEASVAAREAGARKVTRLRPPGGAKDLAAAWEARHG